MATVRSLPLVTVWWIITPCTGPHGPLWLRLWCSQSPTPTTASPSALRASRKPLADMGEAMDASFALCPVAAERGHLVQLLLPKTDVPGHIVRMLCEPIRTTPAT